MTALAFLAFIAAIVTGAAYIVFPSPVTFAATVAALGIMWLIERASCAAAIRRVQAAGGIVNYPALRCIGYATTITGIVGGAVVVMHLLFALLVEAPAP